MRRSFLPVFTCVCLLASQNAHADFGIKDTGKAYEVDTGAGLIVTISRKDADIDKIDWNGVNLSISKGSHIKSGLGGGTKVTSRIIPEQDVIIVTAEVSKAPTKEEEEEDDSGTKETENPFDGLIHYYVFRKNHPTVYMATYIANRFGEMRWITRMNVEKFKELQPGSDLRGNTGAMESADIFRMPKGQSGSKYYGNQQAKDLTIRGVTGPGVGVFMAYGSRESSSGGPFFRDIQNQSVEVYNYMFSGHQQTEPMRVGLHGPYALMFTKGNMPQLPDLSFMRNLDIKGWIKERGRVTGKTSGTLPGIPITVGWANENAQYWADGPNFTTTSMKPGVYEQTLYQGELAVAVKKVTVVAGQTVQSDISAPEPSEEPIWRIGVWDGTPLEFANGKNFPLWHPSDSRNASWPSKFTIGSPDRSFPAAQWGDVNSPIEITFDLKPSQLKDREVVIGITAAYSRGRPHIEVNDWKSKLPSASSQPDSRSLTIGTYRGNNTNFSFKIPSKSLKSGTNHLRIHVGGQGGFGKFLSPGYAFDCIELR